MKHCFIIILCFALFSPLFSQSGNYLFSHIDANQGLSHSQVNSILKDSRGFMWFGTMAGLDRYDGSSFHTFKHSNTEPTSISDNFILNIVEDHLGHLWINTRNGYNIFNPEFESFSTEVPDYLSKHLTSLNEIQRLLLDRNKVFWIVTNNGKIIRCSGQNTEVQDIEHKPGDLNSISAGNIASFKEDSNGDFWTVKMNGTIEQFDGKSFKVKYRTKAVQDIIGNRDRYFESYIDSDNDLWIYCTNEFNGVLYFNVKTKTIEQFSVSSTKLKLNNNLVRTIIEEKPGFIWVGTDHGGINVIDKKNLKVEYLLNQPDEEKSLSQNVITSMYRDNSGIMWVGTYKKGVNYYHPNLQKFKHIRHKVSDPNSLPTDDINCFAEDWKGNLWIGTNNAGLVYYDRAKETFTSYLHNPENSNSPSSDVIVKLYMDKSNILWIGTYMGGLDRFDGSTFKNYKHSNDPNSISFDAVWEIMEDSKSNFWIGTLGGGLNLFDREKDIFYHYMQGEANSVASNYISSVIEDKSGNLWVGTAFGIDVLEKASGNFVHYNHKDNDSNSLSNNNVFMLMLDKRGFIWAGTRDGLNQIDPVSRKFKTYKVEDGLPDNSVLTILEDINGNLWMSTSNGLCNLIISEIKGKKDYIYQFKNYDKSDGLQGKAFNERACFKTRKGEILFGGVNGFNIILPHKIPINTALPKVVLSNFYVFNKPIKVADEFNGRVLLTQSLNNNKKITLKYKENVFSIDFAALNFLHPEKNKFRYKLEGFNKQWLTVDEKLNRATYTNLDPGTYTFIVKASNDDDIWNPVGASIKIVVQPPLWRTNIAILIYVIFLIGVIILARKIILDRARMEFLVEHERQESFRTHELDMMKIRFFTNVSHEFRTPLSLILAPVEKLLQTEVDSDQKKQYILIQRNAKRLLNLVNQLLDFRRMEVQEFKLKPASADIVSFVKDITVSFSDISDKNNVALAFSSNVAAFTTMFDRDKLEKIMFNLLSNAFKFTNGGGNVAVEVEIKSNGSVNEVKSIVEIRVKDTGIGIPADKQDKIFEQFFQNETPGNIINQGSGIGLALTKEFVRVHNGTILVESEPDKGSCFIVRLPVQEYPEFNSQPIKEEIISIEQEEALQSEVGHVSAESAHILIVEDNEDLRFYLKDNFAARYKISEAANGKDALAKAFASIPDIIITDIMMPEMNGIELCKKIKSDKRTSHVPVIFLTARTAEEQKLEGYESGADGYITKPFSFEILESRIRNLIMQRDALRRTFQKHIEINPSEISVTSVDEKLIHKALELVEKNMSNADFSVEELSRELGMSRVHLYKKLLALTGKTPIEFIRTIRLKRAAQLLKKSQLTVSEIAYEVGFNNPKYFTKYFKEEFNSLPSQYVEGKDE